MKLIVPIMLLSLEILTSCTIPKDARILKKSTKEWRKSPVVLSTYSDTPFSGLFLTLRENGKFDDVSSGMIQTFAAGAWTYSQDTIQLRYFDSKQNLTRIQNVIIDRKTSTLIFEGDSTLPKMRPRMVVNKL